jgi:cobalt/nickel transport system permease protein
MKRGKSLSSLQKSMHRVTALEELALKDTPLHRVKPPVKLLLTLIYIVLVVSFPPVEVSGLIQFACIPAFLMIIGEIPLKPLLLRCLVALPFTFFGGLSNLLLDRTVVLTLGSFSVTHGMVTFTSLMLKTVLTVMAVLLLAASTKMNDMIYAMLYLHIPSLLVIQIMMTYRYMSVLLKEATLMYQAYLLRAPGEKGIRLKDMGTFLGQLILRSMDRAERIYHGMQCRGFEGRIHFSGKKAIGIKGWLTVIIIGISMLVLRLLRA